jgi:hypothetical protein
MPVGVRKSSAFSPGDIWFLRLRRQIRAWTSFKMMYARTIILSLTLVATVFAQTSTATGKYEGTADIQGLGKLNITAGEPHTIVGGDNPSAYALRVSRRADRPARQTFSFKKWKIAQRAEKPCGRVLSIYSRAAQRPRNQKGPRSRTRIFQL